MIDSKLDVIATNAEFEGIQIGSSDLDLLAPYWAVAKYDEDVRLHRAEIIAQ